MSENTISNKKQYLVWGAITILYILLAICCFSCSTPKVATVNAPMVVARSQAIRLLQQEQQEQYDSMQNWLQDSNKQLKKETSQDKRKELLAKLQAEFSQKQIAMQQQYLAKTQKIEEDIIGIIKAVADKKGYIFEIDALTIFSNVIEYYRDKPNFANARTVRNVLDQVIMNQNLRTEDEEDGDNIIILQDVEDYIADENIM